ncbi:MAG: hypothetical protein M3O01_14555, partial [Pseudomonadota bacterium]|nr:hypothetical protein [Pseudomonadota bacterium]
SLCRGKPDQLRRSNGQQLTVPGVIVVGGITCGGYKLYKKYDKFESDIQACKIQCENTVACGDPERTPLYPDNAARCMATCKANATINDWFGVGKGPAGPKSRETTPDYFKPTPPGLGKPRSLR